MSTLTDLKEIETRLATKAAVGEFGRLARIATRAKGSPVSMTALGEAEGRLPERLQKILTKADPGMISAPGGSPASWGDSLAYDSLAAAFLESLANSNAFDAALPFMRRVPLKTKVPKSAVAVQGYIVAEGAAKPIAELELSDEALEPRKAAAVIVVTNDLLKLGGSVASALFNAELRNGVAKATDASFVAGIIAETSPTASSGDFLFDVSDLLAAVDGDANSRYFLAVEPSTLKTVAMQAGANGRAFPELTVDGGELGGVTVVASDGLTSGQMLLFDAKQVAADGGTVALDATRNATLDLAGGSQPSFDLFSKDASALRCERWFGFKLLRATAAASISGADYALGSPA